MRTDYWLTGEDRILKWGPGPWVDEPDLVEWQHEPSQYPCLLLRQAEMGAWCGYAGVPPGHPLYGKTASKINRIVHVHCGVNFAEHAKTTYTLDPAFKDCWFFGFDAAHANQDLIPQYIQMGLQGLIKDTVYRDFRYMREQAEILAQGLWEYCNHQKGDT